MQNPEKYSKHNTVQFKINLQYLEEYEPNAAWRKHCDSVIDIGSGDGGFTSNTLVSLLPADFKEVIGCDKKEVMVQFANEKYKKDRVSFEVIDIEKDLPKQYHNRFSQAFSFFTLHLVRNQEKAVSNIYNLLAPGGGCFLVFVGSGKFYDSCRIISKTDKWKSWTSHVEDIIAPYQDCPDPEGTLTKIMTEAGFTEVHVKCKKDSYQYKSLEDYKRGVEAINIFGLPETVLEEFYTDFVHIAKENGVIDDNNVTKFTMIIARAKK